MKASEEVAVLNNFRSYWVDELWKLWKGQERQEVVVGEWDEKEMVER